MARTKNKASLPRGENGVIPLAPTGPAKTAPFIDATISTSTELTLQENTTWLRCYAINQDVCLKWGTDDVSATAFDEIIPAGQIVDLPVPNLTNAPYTAVNVIERVSGGTIIIIEK